MRDSLIKHFINASNNVQLYNITPSQIIFEERVRLKCFHCKYYGVKWTCPPKCINIDYKKVIQTEYSDALVIKYELAINKETFSDVRIRTTNDLHAILIGAENYLYHHNNVMAISFIGGSCKLCKNGCGTVACNNPANARIPMEGAGINVIKTMRQVGEDVIFPIRDSLARYGLFLWGD